MPKIPDIRAIMLEAHHEGMRTTADARALAKRHGLGYDRARAIVRCAYQFRHDGDVDAMMRAYWWAEGNGWRAQ